MLDLIEPFIEQMFLVVLSGSTLLQVYLIGNLYRKAWLLASFNQCMWLVWILVSGQHNLIFANLIVGAMYITNHYKWSRNVIIQQQGTKPDT